MFKLILCALFLFVRQGRAIYWEEKGYVSSAFQGGELPFDMESPAQIWKDQSDNIFVAVFEDNQVHMISRDGNMKTIAGRSQTSTASVAMETLEGPYGLVGDNKGNLYISEFTGNRIRQLALATGDMATLAGSVSGSACAASGDQEMPAVLSLLCGPRGLFLQGTLLYVADSLNHRVRALDLLSGMIRTVAGTSGQAGYLDGPQGLLHTPYAIWADEVEMFVADHGNSKVRMMKAADGVLATLPLPMTMAPTGVYGYDDTLYIVGSHYVIVFGQSIQRLPGNLLGNGLFIDERGMLYLSTPHRIYKDNTANGDRLLTAVSESPSFAPTEAVGDEPSVFPTFAPSTDSTDAPSALLPSETPSMVPSLVPSLQSSAPTLFGSAASEVPSMTPSDTPTVLPSATPTLMQSQFPSQIPTVTPSEVPSMSMTPSASPSFAPSQDMDTALPSMVPSEVPSTILSDMPFSLPSAVPSSPSVTPSASPSQTPSETASLALSAAPSVTPSTAPSVTPSEAAPSAFPTFSPTVEDNRMDSASPTTAPSDSLSRVPSKAPSLVPTFAPTMETTLSPTTEGTGSPSMDPSASPSLAPSASPSLVPSASPSQTPSTSPSLVPSASPSLAPSASPSQTPSASPSLVPSASPSLVPSATPSLFPTAFPNSTPAPSVDESLKLLIPSNITSVVLARVERTSIAVNVTVAVTGGMVYCAASLNGLPGSAEIVGQGVGVLASGYGVQISISALIPYTPYVINCTTISSRGNNYLPNAVAKLHSLVQSTSCCKLATVSMPAVIFAGTQVDVLTVTLGHKPSVGVTIGLVFVGTGASAGATVLPVAYPSSFDFASTSAVLSLKATIVGVEGNFTLVATASGTSVAEYGGSTGAVLTSKILTVLSADAEPSTPVLTEGRFTADGTAVELKFDSATNSAGYSSIFPCATLLSFASNRSAVCQFTSRSVIKIYQGPGSTPFLSLHDTVTLKSSVLKAFCASGNTVKCNTWAYVSEYAVDVQPPVFPTLPTVVIGGPSSIGACQSLLLDLTTSSGSAGRKWISTSLTVQSGSVALNSFLSSEYVFNPPKAIPANLLTKGVSYTFTGTFCNFLSACATATKIVQVTTDSSLLPVVTLDGAATKNIGRNVSLDLRATAFTESCTGEVSYSNLRYNWSLALISGSLNGLDLTALKSASQNPAIFRVSSFVLPSGASFMATVMVVYIDPANGAVSTPSATSVRVNVVPGAIIATIKGGAKRLVQTDTTTTISAASSFDQDVTGQTGARAGLQFSWSCSQIAPVFSPNCDSTLGLAGTSNEDVRVTPVGLTSVNTTSRLTVTVFGGSRSSSAFTDVTITTDRINTLSIVTPPETLTSVPTNQRFALEASLDIVSACTAIWRVDDSSIVLDTASLTPPTKVFAIGVGYKFNLALLSNQLPQRASLIFSLSCGSASSAISVGTNGAPLPGRFAVTNTTGGTVGSELQDKFSFVASDWVDNDLPITYQFSFFSPSSSAFMVAAGRSQTSYTSSKLPAGSADNMFLLNCSVEIFDTFDASVLVFTPVTVHELDSSAQAGALTNLLGDSDSGSIDDKKGAVSIASSVMNRLNCSLANSTVCAGLNRDICKGTAQTCGPCLESYRGESGDANSFCALESRRLMGVAAVCTVDGDCNDGTKYCDTASSSCLVRSRACPANCSSPHGTCSFSSVSTGKHVTTCKMDDFTCQAICTCVTGYSGSGCGISDADLASKRSLRESLVNTLENIVISDDISSSSLFSWSSYLDAVANNPFELSVGGVNTVRTLAAITATYGKALGVDYTAMRGVLTAVDALVSIAYLDYNAALQANGETLSNGPQEIVDILTNYTDFVTDNMVYGQADVVFVYNNFRIVGSVLSVGDALTRDLVVPAAGQPKSSSLQFTPAATAPADAVVASSLIQIYKKSVNASSASFFSDPLRLKLVDSTGASADHLISNIAFTIANNDALSAFTFGNDTGGVFETNCTKVHSVETFTCPYTGHVITHTCSGIAGTYTSYCPIIQPTCAHLNLLTGLTNSNTSCVTVSFDANYTTCSCDLQTARRLMSMNLQAVDLLEQTGLVDMAAASKQVAMDFKNTFRSANALNSASGAQQALVIILLFTILWGLGAVAVAVVHFKESRASWRRQRALVDGDTLALQATDLINNYIDSILPAVYSGDSLVKGFWKEISVHHRYLELMGHRDARHGDLLSRLHRALRVLTIETLSIFLQAVFFDLQRPTDDGTCEANTTEAMCLDRKTVLDHNANYCEWNVADSSCSYDSHGFSTRSLVYVIIITTICTAVLKLPLDMLLKMWIRPLVNGTIVPTNAAAEGGSVKAEPSPSRPPLFERSEEEHAAAAAAEGAAIIPEVQMDKHDEASLDELTGRVLALRTTLVPDAGETQLFDRQWGLTAEGVQPRAITAPALHTIGTSIAEAAKECRKREGKLSRMELLHLFMVDLLGRRTTSAVIFQNKFTEDFESLHPIPLWAKALAIFLVLGLNGFFIYYCCLRGVSRGLEWQLIFLQTVLIQLALEVCIFETLECVWVHYIVPNVVKEDVGRAVQVLTEISAHPSLLRPDEEKGGSSFSSPHYLFVSTRLAELDSRHARYPDVALGPHNHAAASKLVESQIVMAYRNIFPGMIAKTWPHYRRVEGANAADRPRSGSDALPWRDPVAQGEVEGGRPVPRCPGRGALLFPIVSALASGLIYALQAMGVLPFAVQKASVRFFQQTVLSGLVLLFYWAVDHPLWFIAAALVIAVILLLALVRAFFRTEPDANSADIGRGIGGAAEVFPADKEGEKEVVHSEGVLIVREGVQQEGTSIGDDADEEAHHPSGGLPLSAFEEALPPVSGKSFSRFTPSVATSEEVNAPVRSRGSTPSEVPIAGRSFSRFTAPTAEEMAEPDSGAATRSRPGSRPPSEEMGAHMPAAGLSPTASRESLSRTASADRKRYFQIMTEVASEDIKKQPSTSSILPVAERTPSSAIDRAAEAEEEGNAGEEEF